MPIPTHDEPTNLSNELVTALDGVFGYHPGHRPVHAKGLLFAGVFTPSADAASLTRAPHAREASTPVSVRFSDSTGIPAIPDNDPNASPRGIAIRFHLGKHVHTDIIAHSHNGFPVRTGEEFAEFLRAIAAAKSATPDPAALESFLASHSTALAFVSAPQQIPTSFARESYFGVTAFQFTNEAGVSCYGRFRVIPEAGGEYLSTADAAAKTPNFLFEEISERVSQGPVRLQVLVQVAASGDTVDDSTAVWPEDRRQIEFGTLTLTEPIAQEEPEHRRIIFDPVPRVDGIDPSGDPLTAARSGAYLLSGRRRRAAGEHDASPPDPGIKRSAGTEG